MPRILIDITILTAILAVPIVMVFALALASGWTRLARAYPPPPLRRGKSVRFQNAQVGKHLMGGINNGLNILVHEEGLRFSVVIVGFAYRAFFVPWEDVEVIDRTKTHVRLIFAREPNVPLKISPRTFERIMALAPASH